MRSGKCLGPAVASTIAAAVWLANCVIEATIGLTIRGAGKLIANAPIEELSESVSTDVKLNLSVRGDEAGGICV